MSKHVILGTDWCPFCIRVYDYLNKNKIPYENVDTDQPDGAKKRAELSKKYNYHTVPMVFINGEFIGGCNEFFAALSQKKLNL